MTQYRELLENAIDAEELGSALLPDQAVVVRRSPNGQTSWVRFVGEPATSPATQVPVAQDCPVGTTVWVFRTGGGKGFAVPQGLTQPPIAFDGYFEYADTTNIADFHWVTVNTLTVPAGTYRANGHATFSGLRTVASSDYRVAVRVGGQQGTVGVATSGAYGAVAYRPHTLSTNIGGVTFTTAGTVLVELGFRGDSVAGTTAIMPASVSGTLTRIA